MTDPLAAIKARHQAELDAREFARTHVCTETTLYQHDYDKIGAAMRDFCSIRVVNDKGELRGRTSKGCRRLTPMEEEAQLHDDVGVLLGEIDRLNTLLSNKTQT